MDGPEDLAQFTVQRLASLFTPQQAARVKWRVASVRLASGRDAYTDRIDRIVADNPGHRMFVYCLDAVARQAPAR